MVNGYAWYTESERRGTSPPLPPSKGGKSEAKGGCYPFKGGKERSEAHEALTFWLLLGQAKSNGKIMSGFQPSQRGMGIDTPPLRDGAEIYRAFSPFGQ